MGNYYTDSSCSKLSRKINKITEGLEEGDVFWKKDRKAFKFWKKTFEK